MTRLVTAAVGAFAFALSVNLAIADDGGKLIGAWRLLKFDFEFQDGSPKRAVFGAKPIGIIIFSPQGRMAAVLEAEGRKAPENDTDAAALLRTLIAYSGTYKLEQDKWTTTVDVAWTPAWHGTQQVRYYKLDGDRLFITSMWQPNQNLPGKPVTRGVLEWERVK
jgi:hypothetical protein